MRRKVHKATTNQARASLRKRFIKELEGGLLRNDPIKLPGGDVVRYAGNYIYEQNAVDFTINFYSDPHLVPSNPDYQRARVLPYVLKVGSKTYMIKYNQVSKDRPILLEKKVDEKDSK